MTYLRFARRLLLAMSLALFIRPLRADSFLPPASPRRVFSFNANWKFIRQDVADAEQAGFEDSHWSDVSAPHTYNDTDTYDEIISHSGGERHEYMGIAWYRKHFKLPAAAKDGKVFLEFEGLKQAGRFWVNGQFAGKYENGVTPFGLDLTPFVHFGEAENVIAVKVDNSNDYVEEATGVGFEWMGRAFNPNYGGLNHDIWLHLTGRIYQTLPLYENLKTTGVYVYSSAFSVNEKQCGLTVESQARNETGHPRSITLSAVVVDSLGAGRARFQGEPVTLAGGETKILTASGRLADVQFWSAEQPNLYNVYSMLEVNHTVVDAQKITTGFRETEFKGGAGAGGVYLNGHFVYLTGYAQRSSDDWAGLGEAYPDWMHDFNARLIRDTHANYIRWMHIAPQAADARACDKAGIIEICPAGDKEKDVTGRQWEQRLEVMRDAMIYFRDDPSILFWEAGNNGVTPEHLRQMVDLRKQWDPHGGRAVGCRTLNDEAATPIAEYFGVMVGQDRRTDALKGYTNQFRAYSAERRDRAPLIEAEDFRDEAARRFWDDYSPPHFGFKPGPNDTYHWNSETFCLAAALRYHDYFINCISNTNPARSKWSGYASIYWSDSNADGRQDSSEVCRVSGKVDSVRLPKEAFYVYRVMQNPAPDIHIIGHWTYPEKMAKTIYVAANHCGSVELFVNGKSLGESSRPCDFSGDTGYIYAFPSVAFEPGRIEAVGKIHGQIAARDSIETAGPPVRIKLTPHVSPDGFLANGSDVALFDVEAVDASGRRCPTDEQRVDFSLAGPAIWRGGYNSGITNSVNNLYLDTECGINRVAIRSTLQSGPVTLTASRPGLEPCSITLGSRNVELDDGLAPMARRFEFGGNRRAPVALYSDAAGFGFEPGAEITTNTGCAASAKPFYFSVKLAEGNYRVTVRLGHAAGESDTTIKAESRRLMLEHVHTAAGQYATRSFIVNLRTPKIEGDGEVRVKPREKASEWWDWDGKLTLEFNGARPCLDSLEIEQAGVPTVFILGDSTVCDQPAEPWNSWGQMLPRFFKPDVAIANHAESGETIASSIGARRFAKVFSLMKPGDYLFMQFGHNDMKSKAPDALEKYKQDLRQAIGQTRAKGGTPVLVTSMERAEGASHPTLAGYPEAVREVAGTEHCALIDLNKMSVAFYKALGPELKKAFQDGTHHNNYGSYELAKCVVEGVRKSQLPLRNFIVDDFGGFDPGHPDSPDAFHLPASPVHDGAKPLGN